MLYVKVKKNNICLLFCFANKEPSNCKSDCDKFEQKLNVCCQVLL